MNPIVIVIKFLQTQLTTTIHMFLFNICNYFGKLLTLRRSAARKSAIMALENGADGFLHDPKNFWTRFITLPGKFSFEKYIYLSNTPLLKGVYARNIPGSFLIYMVTLKMSASEDEPQQQPPNAPEEIEISGDQLKIATTDKQLPTETAASQSSVACNSVTTQSESSLKSKKSSNILFRLIGKTRSKQKKSSEIKIPAESCDESRTSVASAPPAGSSIEDVPEKKEVAPEKSLSKSKIPVPKTSSSKEVAVLPKSSEARVVQTPVASAEKVQSVSPKNSEPQIEKPSKNPSSFFRKLITKAKSSETRSKSNLAVSTDVTNAEEEVCLRDVDMSETSNLKLEQKTKESGATRKTNSATGASKLFSYVTSSIPLRYINCNSPFMDITLADGLHQIMEISAKLRDSETHIIHILTRYIQDDSFQKDLLDSVYQHSKLQMETERRVQALANEMWLQQADISRQQERIMQESLNAIVKQNRQLQEENEALLRNAEKLVTKGSSGISYLHTRAGNSHLIEDLTKSNDKLQKKVNSMYKQTEDLENELINLQKLNNSLEERVRSLNSQVQNYKCLLQRSSADHELEVASLNQQLHSSQLMINDSIEAGDVLLEDLDALKRLSKSMSCGINWSKFKCRGKSLTDLIHVGRSCINELCREVTSMQNQLTLKDKDNDGLREQNVRLQESLHKASSELDKAVTDLEVYRKREMETNDFHQKYKELEEEVNDYKAKLQDSRQTFEKTESVLESRISEVESLQKQLESKSVELQETQKSVTNYETEVNSLKVQVNTLNDALTSSGAGDTARELSEAQKRISAIQNDYYQLLNEKNGLMEQLTCATAEREVLHQYQQTYYQYLQSQQKHLESLTKDNVFLKEQAEYQRSTIQALQAERMRHLDEKNVLRAIYQQFKLEITKTEKLKSTMANMDKETHWLSVVAEYNRQLGEKLMSEMHEKDKTITKLQKSVEMLNNAQTENTKDKIALCVELNEVATVKDQLSNSLTTEVKKETEATTKLKTLEEMQRIERLALKELLNDYKNVVAQRDQAVSINRQSTDQISVLQEHLNVQIRNSEALQAECKNKDDKIKEMGRHLQDMKNAMEDAELAMKKDVLQYDNHLSHLLSTNEKMMKEKENLEESIKYLQNTTQKLHGDLNEARQKDMETKLILSKETEERCKFEMEANEYKAALHSVEQQNRQLGTEIENLRALCDKLLNDYEVYTQAASEKTVSLLEDASKSKKDLTDNTIEIENLMRVVAEKNDEIQFLKHQMDCLGNKNHEMDINMRDLEQQARLLGESHHAQEKLQETLLKMKTQLEAREKELSVVKEEIQALQSELQTTKKLKEEETSMYKQQIQDLKNEYNSQKQSILDELQKVNSRFVSLNQILEHEKTAQTGIISANSELSDKLFKAIKMLIEEKLNCQKQETKSQDLVQQVARFKAEKTSLLEQYENLSRDLAELKRTNQELSAEKQSILTLLSETQKMNRSAQSKYEALEEQLNDVMEKRIGQAKIKISSTASRDIELETETWEMDPHQYQYYQERLILLKTDLVSCHNTIVNLQAEISTLQQQVTVLEFQKCELSLRLHESESALETERSLLMELRQVQQRILVTLTKMKDDDAISSSNYETLFYMVGKPDVRSLNAE